MKKATWYRTSTLLARLALAAPLALCGYAQSLPASAQTQPDAGGSATAACGSAPCSQGQPLGAAVGKPARPLPAMTPEKAARVALVRRYSDVFAHLEAQEQLAQSYEAKGDAASAASWRADFARKAGLTSDEAERVKKIAKQYRLDFLSLNADCHAALMAARDAHIKVQHSDPGSIPSSCGRLDSLFDEAMADLLKALGSKSFTRLDSYAIHLQDNDKILDQQGQPASSTAPQTVKPAGTPR